MLGPLGGALSALGAQVETATGIFRAGGVEAYQQKELVPLKQRIDQAPSLADKAADLIMQGVHPDAISKSLLTKQNMEVDAQFGAMVDQRLFDRGYSRKFGEDPNYTMYYRNQQDLMEEWISSLPEIEASWDDVFNIKNVPILGTIAEVRNSRDLVKRLNRINAGEEEGDDIQVVEKWILESYSPKSRGKQWVEGLMGTLAFAGDLAVTGGASAIGKGAIKMMTPQVVKSAVNKVLLRSMEQGILGSITKKAAASTVLGAAMRGGKAVGKGVAASAETMAVERGLSMGMSAPGEGDMTRGMAERTELQDQLAQALDLGVNPETGQVEWSIENNPSLNEISMDSEVKTFIELFSERLGGIAGQVRLGRGGVAAQTWPMAQRLYPGLTRGQWGKRIADATQIGGAGGPVADLVAETAEEYAVRFMGATYGSITGDPKDRQVNWDEVIPNVDDAVMELSIIAVPVLGSRGLSAADQFMFEKPRTRQMRETMEQIDKDIVAATTERDPVKREQAQERVDDLVARTRVATPEQAQAWAEQNGVEIIGGELSPAMERVAARLSETGVQVVPVRRGDQTWNGAYDPSVPGTIFLGEDVVTELESNPAKAAQILQAVGYHEALHDAEVVVGPELWQELVQGLKTADPEQWDAASQAMQERLGEDRAAGLDQAAIESETPAQMVEENHALIHGIRTNPRIRNSVERLLGENRSRFDAIVDRLFGWVTRSRDAKEAQALMPRLQRDIERDTTVTEGGGQAETKMTLDGLTSDQWARMRSVDKIAALMDRAVITRNTVVQNALLGAQQTAEAQVPEEAAVEVEAETVAPAVAEPVVDENVSPEFQEWLETAQAGAAQLERADTERRGQEIEQARLQQEFGAEAAQQAREETARVPEPQAEIVEPQIAEPAPTPVAPVETPQRYIEVDTDAPAGTEVQVGSRVRVRGEDMRAVEVERLTGQGQQQRAKLADGRSVLVRNLVPQIKTRKPGAYLEPVERMPIGVGAEVRVPAGVKTEGKPRKVKGPLTVERITGPLGKQRAKLSDGRIVSVSDLRVRRKAPGDHKLSQSQKKQAQLARLDALRSRTRFSPSDLSPVEVVSIIEDTTDPFLRMSPRAGVPVLDRFDMPEMSRAEKMLGERFFDRFLRIEQFEDWIRNYGISPEGDASPLSVIRRYPGRTKQHLEDSERRYFRPIKDLLKKYGIEYDLASDYLAYRHVEEANEALELRRRQASDLRAEADQQQADLDEKRQKYRDEQRRLRGELRGVPMTLAQAETISGEMGRVDVDPAERRQIEQEIADKRQRADEIDPGEQAVEWKTTEEARAWLEDISRRDEYEGLVKIGEIVDRMNAQTRQWQVDSGLISRDQYEAWEAQFDHYVPMRSAEHESSWNEGRGGGGFDVKGAETQMRKGRTTRPDALSFSLLQHRATINRSEKNRIGQTFLRLMEAANQVLDVRDVTVDEMIARTGKDGRKNKEYDKLFYLKVDGKQKEIAIRDADLARAIKNLDAQQLGPVMNFIRRWTRRKANLLTTWNFGFFIPNAVKDAIQAQMLVGELRDSGYEVSRAGLAKDAFKSFKAVLGYKYERPGDELMLDMYRRYREAGGLIGVAAEATIEAVESDMRREFDSGTLATRLRIASDHLERIGDAFEQANRLAVFKAMVEAGASDAKAAEVARGITVDFNRGGTWTAGLNSWKMFSNASIQGNLRNIRAIQGSKKVRNMLAHMFLFGFINDMLNAALSDEDEDGRLEWDNKSAWDRSFNLHLPGTGMKIPMPYFWNLTMAGGQFLGQLARGVISAEEGAALLGGIAVDTLMPTTVPSYDVQGLVQALAPSLGQEVADVAVNRDYKGDRIYHEAFDSITPESTLGQEAASAPVAKFIFEMTGGDAAKAEQSPWTIDIHPDAADYVFGGLLGGLGDGLVNMSKTASRLYQTGSVRGRDVSVLRRFNSAPNPYGPVGNFYEHREAMKAARKQWRVAEEGYDAARESGDTDMQSYWNKRGKTLKNKYSFELRDDAYKESNRVEKKLKELREKRDALSWTDMVERDEIEKEMSTIAGNFVRKADAAKAKSEKQGEPK